MKVSFQNGRIVTDGYLHEDVPYDVSANNLSVCFDGKGGITYGQWVEYKFPISTLMNNSSNLFFLFYREPMAEGTVYVADIYVANEPEVVDADEVLDFDEEADLEQVWQTRPEGRVNFEWLESYEGETGVLKMVYNDDGPTFFFNAAQELSAYEGYDYVVFKVFIDETYFHHIGLNEVRSYYDATENRSESLGDLVYGEWVELKFDIATLQNNFENLSLVCYRGPMGEGTIYVSDIYVVNEATNA